MTFHWELAASGSLSRAQTVALTTMVLFQIFHVGNCRSERLSLFQKSPLSNPFLFVSTVASFAVHVAALYLGPTQFVLRVEPLLDPGIWIRMVAVASSILVAIELHKLLRRRSARETRTSGATMVMTAKERRNRRRRTRREGSHP